jgi:hypothetical protein
MADYTFDQLKKKKIADLREIAKGIEHEAVKGYTQLRKDELLVALCKAVGIDPRHHAHVVGIDKGAIKKQIAALKGERDAALAARDREKLHRVRRRIHKLKHQLRAAAF